MNRPIRMLTAAALVVGGGSWATARPARAQVTVRDHRHAPPPPRAPAPARPQAPVVIGFAPTAGLPGTVVRLTGSGFTDADRVQYGWMRCTVRSHAPGWIDVEVPAHAHRSSRFTVRGPGGVTHTSRPFDLEEPPAIRSFAPPRGTPGTQVVIRGRHFQDGDWVSLAGRRLPTVKTTERAITVTVTPGSRSGPVMVGRRSFRVTARRPFEVLDPPAVATFVPSRGPAGSRVTLSGRNLAGAKVYYGKRRLPVVTYPSDNSLVVAIPAGAHDETFRVVTRAGEAQAPRPFHVQVDAQVDRARPTTGTPGGTVVLEGRHLDMADRFWIGGGLCAIVSRTPRSATVRLSREARTGPVAWESNGRRGQTSWRVTVYAPPRIGQFQPDAGPPGTRIILRGAHFDQGTQIYFGSHLLPRVRLTGDHELAVRLPRGVGGSDYLYAAGHGARTRSDQRFQVRVAPVIEQVSPLVAVPGQRVDVRGRWFNDATEILVGPMRARVLSRSRPPGAITIEVPASVRPGRYRLSARDGALVTVFRQPLEVKPGARPKAPVQAPPHIDVRDHRRGR